MKQDRQHGDGKTGHSVMGSKKQQQVCSCVVLPRGSCSHPECLRCELAEGDWVSTQNSRKGRSQLSSAVLINVWSHRMSKYRMMMMMMIVEKNCINYKSSKIIKISPIN